MPEAIFLPGLSMLIPEREEWNGRVLQEAERYTHLHSLVEVQVLGFSIGNSVLNFRYLLRSTPLDLLRNEFF